MRCLLIFAAFLAICPSCNSINKPEQANILLVLVDDMETDQTETYDLINEFPDIADGLRAEWEKWLEDSNIGLE